MLENPQSTTPLLWHLLTRLGEAQILLPLVGAAALWLWRSAALGRLALRWLLSIGVVALATTLSKLAFMGWGWGSAAWDFTGFSGHAMFAAACLPMLGWVVGLGRGRGLHLLATIAGFALAALVAYSRLVVLAHSPSEAALGFALGALASLVVLRAAPDLRLVLPLWLPAGLAACLLLLPVSLPRSRSHELMTQLSLRLSGHERVFTRQDLHRRLAPLRPALPPAELLNAAGARTPSPTAPSPHRPSAR